MKNTSDEKANIIEKKRRTEAGITKKNYILEEMRQLEADITQHNRLYYHEATPRITDAEYDKLFRRLQELEAKHSHLASPKSPTKKVGYLQKSRMGEESKTFFHPVPMLSLANAMDEEELESFLQLLKKNYPTIKQNFCLTPKMDGSAVELVYTGGIWKLGSTRGDGYEGEIITNNLKDVSGFPHQLDFSRLEQTSTSTQNDKKSNWQLHKNLFDITQNCQAMPSLSKEIVFDLHAFFCGTNDKKKTVTTAANTKPMVIVRGEIVISLPNFMHLNKKLTSENSKLAANPRNYVAGQLKQKNQPSNVPMQFFAYSLEFSEELWNEQKFLTKEAQNILNSQTQQLLLLENLGFHIVRPLKKITQPNLQTTKLTASSYYQQLLSKRPHLDYEMDGVVLKIDEIASQRYMGEVDRRPRWAIAWKFPVDEKISTLEKIDFQVGRTGRITPVALIQPILLEGALVSKATLHNETFIKKLSLQLGDAIIVARSGGVIPKIIGKSQTPNNQQVNNSHQNNKTAIIFPNKCPACKTTLQKELLSEAKNENKKEGIIHFCPNQHCPQREIRTLVHFAKKSTMNIDGLGIGIVELLYKKKIVTCFADIFTLSAEKLLALESFQEKKTNNLLSSISAAKKPTLAKFIYALGIPHVGFKTATAIANLYGDVQSFLRCKKEDMLNSSIFNSSLTPLHAKIIAAYMQNNHAHKNIVELLNVGVAPKSTTEHQLIDENTALQIMPLKNKKVLFLGNTAENVVYLKDAIKKQHGKVIKSLKQQLSTVNANSSTAENVQDKTLQVQESRLEILRMANIIVFGQKNLQKQTSELQKKPAQQKSNKNFNPTPIAASEDTMPLFASKNNAQKSMQNTNGKDTATPPRETHSNQAKPIDFPKIIPYKNWKTYFSYATKDECVFSVCDKQYLTELKEILKKSNASLCTTPLAEKNISKKITCIAISPIEEKTITFISENNFRTQYLTPNFAKQTNDDTTSLTKSKLLGKRVLFTGKFPVIRSELQAKVEAAGGMAVSVYTKQISYLVVGEKPGSKLKKAQIDKKTNNIEILSLEEFLPLLDGE